MKELALHGGNEHFTRREDNMATQLPVLVVTTNRQDYKMTIHINRRKSQYNNICTVLLLSQATSEFTDAE